MTNAVNCSLMWTCAATSELLASWREEGFVCLQCHEPGFGRATPDNYLAVKLSSPYISDWKLAWTCRATQELLSSWSNNGYQYVKCNEPGWGGGWETEDNYFAIRVLPKDPNHSPKNIRVELDWKCNTTQSDMALWHQNGFTYVKCDEPGLGGPGASSDNYLAIKILTP